MKTSLDFSAYIADRTRDFTGREWLFAAIDHWLADPDASQIFLLTGEPGIGKTAVAARLTQFSAGTETPPADYAYVGPGFLGAVHFCSARNGGWISPDDFARSLSAQLAARYPAFAEVLVSGLQLHVEQRIETNLGTAIGVHIANYHAETAPMLFNNLVRRPLQALCCADNLSGPLVILVDGLDEALSYSGRVSIVRLLAACGDLPPQVRLLLTSRPMDGVLEPFRPLQPSILFAHSEENQRDVRAYVRHRFETSAVLQDQAGDETQVGHVTTSLVTRSGGNFLVVSRVLDGIERGELSPDDPEALPAELQDLYAWFLDRLTQGDMRVWRTLYRPVLGVLAVAQEPVDAPAFYRWTGLTRQQVTDALHDLREFLDLALDRRYRLYHESVVDFLTGDGAGPYTLDAAEYHRQIAASYTQRFIGNGEEWSDCNHYGLRYLPVHLFETGQTETLRGLLFDFDWLQAKLDATDITALLADFELIPDDGDLRLVQGAIRLSAHVLAEDKTQLAGQLLGRLLSYEVLEIRALLKRAKQWKATPRLRPLTPSLTLPSGPLLRTMTGHTDAVLAVGVTPDGGQVISASSDRTLKVWNLEVGKELRSLTGHTARVRAVVVTPDGRRVISASSDRTLKVWDLQSGIELLTLLGHKHWVWAVAVTPDGQCAISASSDHTLKVWNLGYGEESCTLTGHTDEVRAVAVTPDGHRAVSASGDHTLKVWNLQSGEELLTLAGHTAGVMAVAVTPDGHRAISASGDSTLKVWNLQSGEELRTLTGHSASVRAVTVTPDGQHVISASSDHTLKMWDLRSGGELCTLAGHTHWVRAVAVTPDGRQAISASDDRTLRVWDLQKGRKLHSLIAHTRRVRAVTVTPDGRQAISASDDRTLKVWDLERREEVYTLTGHRAGVRDVAVTPNGRQAVSASSDCTLKVWDLEGWQELCTLTGHIDGVIAVAVTPDGRRVISSSFDNTLKVWDLQSGKELYTLTSYSVSIRAIAVTPDGRLAIFASDDSTLKVWDLQDGEELRTLTGHTHWVRAVAVTPDGQRAISASEDRTLKMWDLRRGEELCTLTGHTAWVRAVAVTPDGHLAMSASDDHTLRVWDLQSEKAIATFSGEGPISTCAVAPGGVTVIAGEMSGRVHFLRLEGTESNVKRDA